MGDSSWVEDFSQFKDSHSSMGLTGRKSGGNNASKTIQHTQTRAEKIQAELKLLEWHKLANDAALKAALMQTKTLRSEIPQVKAKHVADDAKWIKKVIEQEHMKSLEVSKDYVMKYEAKQKDVQERQSAAIEKHVDTLSKTRKRFEDKVHLKKTTNEYREFQRKFAEKKWAILKGETLEDFENKKRAQSSGGPATNDDENQANGTGERIPPPSDLTNVLESLNKLAVLEKRISTLEGQNEYEKLNMRNRIPAQERTSLEFKKKRGLGDGNVKKLVYTIKPKRTAYGSSSGGGANAVRNKRSQRGSLTTRTENGDDGGTFLTGGDFGGGMTGLSNNTTKGQAMTREERMRARRRDLEQATPGQKSMRNRIQAKKAKVREALVSNKRHNDAMSELTRRRREQGAREKGKRQASRINERNGNVSRAHKGASAGIRTKNKHLADFQKAKGAHQKRREDMAKRTLNRVNKKGRDNAAFRAAAANGGSMGLQSHSATAPANSRSRGGRTSVRGGTNTRRSSSGAMPTRRARSQGAEMPVHGIVGGGVNGLRALRGSRVQRGGNNGPGNGRGNNDNSGLSLQGIGSRR